MVSFYKELFGHSKVSSLKLGASFWPDELKISAEDSWELVKAFGAEEIKRVIMEMKENSAPGPNGRGDQKMCFSRDFGS